MARPRKSVSYAPDRDQGGNGIMRLRILQVGALPHGPLLLRARVWSLLPSRCSIQLHLPPLCFFAQTMSMSSKGRALTLRHCSYTLY